MTIQERRHAPPADQPDSLAQDWQRAQAEFRLIGEAVGSITDELRVLLVKER